MAKPLDKKARQLCQRATHVYICVMLAVFPLFTGPGGYFALNQKKFAFFAAATALWSVTLILATALRLYSGGRWVLRPLDWAVLAFMAACTLSAVVSGASFLSVHTGRCDGLLTYLLYGCMVLGISRYGEASMGYVYAFGASYTLCCAITSIQLLGYNPLYLYPRGYNFYDPVIQEVVPFLGTVGNIDLLSALHCLAIPMLVAAAVMGARAHRRAWLLLIPAAMGMVCALAAGVASGILALGVIAAVFAWGLAARRMPRRAVAILTMLCLLAVGLAVYAAPVESGTLWELKSILHGHIGDEFGSGRIGIWRGVLKVIGQRPLLGVGPDRLGDVLDIQFQRYSQALGETLSTYADNAHNEYLNLLAGFGLAGFIPAVAGLGIAAKQIARARRASPWLARLCPGLLCYMLQAFFNIGLCITTPVFCIFLALALAPARAVSLTFASPGDNNKGA